MNNLDRDDIKPGDEIEVQLSPFGTFSGMVGDKPVMQQCSPDAFAHVMDNFSSEVLVDFEHNAEGGGSGDTRAAAWVQSVWIDEELGLMAALKLTDRGVEAIASRQLRFLSPVWLLDDNDAPYQLVSVGLTNKPNLPVRPVLNKAPALDQPNQPPNKDTYMEELKSLLGLAPEATDADVITAVSTLLDDKAKAEEAALNAEAEACAEENKDKVANKAEFVKAYCTNKQVALAMLGSLKSTPAPRSTVCNKAAARMPQLAGAAPDHKATYDAMPPGPAKDAYLVANKAAIVKGYNACTNKEQ